MSLMLSFLSCVQKKRMLPCTEVWGRGV
jgi:hypothetical protein